MRTIHTNRLLLCSAKLNCIARQQQQQHFLFTSAFVFCGDVNNIDTPYNALLVNNKNDKKLLWIDFDYRSLL